MAAATEQTLEWGTGRDLSPLDALMWRAEADPRLRSTMVGLELLDRAPDWDRLVAAHEWATRMVPRLRRRVVDWGIAPPEWVADPEVDLTYHLRRVALPTGAGWPDLLALAAQMGMAPFDKARPPWEAVLFEGLPDGRAAYALKLHHAATDGIGGVALIGGLHRRARDPDPAKPQPEPPPGESYAVTRALARQAAADLRATARFIGHRPRDLAHPRRSLREGVDFLRSLRRVLADPDVEGSPLLRDRGLSWRFLAVDVPFAALRGAAKAAGGSLNDAYLAGLLGGFRRYHEELGASIETIPMAVPISVRREDDPQGGNRIAAARFAGPMGIAHPRERMQAVQRIVRAARAEPAMEGVALLAPAMSPLPGPLIGHLAGGVTKNNDLQASNIPGIRDEVFLAGARVERFYPFGPLPGCATMITLLSHGDTCCIGVNLDPAAVREPERFGRCLVEGLDEVLALAPDGGRAELLG